MVISGCDLWPAWKLGQVVLDGITIGLSAVVALRDQLAVRLAVSTAFWVL